MLHRFVRATPQIDHLIYSMSGTGVMAASLRDAGATILSPEKGGWNDLPVLNMHLFRHSPDVVQGWMYHGNAASLGASIFAPKSKLFWNIRQSLPDMTHVKRATQVVIRSQAIFSRVPKSVIYNSEIGAINHEAIGFSRSRRVIIPNGFDCDMFKPDADARAAIRKELGIPSQRLTIGLIARHDSWKNHEGFFRMAGRLLERHPELTFVLAGNGVTWASEAFSALVEGSALRDRVHLLGDRRDVTRINAALDIACNVSHGEGFPNAVGEAMACGVPCVVTPVGASAELVGDPAMVTRSTSDDDLVSAVERLLAMAPADRIAIGANARRRICECFSIEAVAQRYLDLYAGVDR